MAIEGQIVVVGEFDGFHIGHRRLLRVAELLAREQRRGVAAVVIDDGRRDRLTSPGSTARSCVRAGAASAFVLPIPAEAPGDAHAPADLVTRIIRRCRPSTVIVSTLPGIELEDRNPAISEAARAHELEVVGVPSECDALGTPVRSARIREAISLGDVAQAATWLGAPYSLGGEVVHGNKLGRTIGYPTANLRVPDGRALPAFGVYVADAALPNGERHTCVVNIGVRPTVATSTEVRIEAHLLDFDGDLYGRRLDISFHDRLRDEMKFDSLDALVAQLGHDVDNALAIRPAPE